MMIGYRRWKQGAMERVLKLELFAAPDHDFAYQLYQTCKRKSWAKKARAYSELVITWPGFAEALR